jgi:hypothetical protein
MSMCHWARNSLEGILTGPVGWSVNVFGHLLILLVVTYVVKNDSGHSAVNFWFLVPVFMGVFSIGSLFCVGGAHASWSAQQSELLGRLLCLTGAFGVALPVLLSSTKIMLQYNAWASAGMPSPPFWRISAIITYLGLFVLANSIVVFISRHR